MTTDKKDRAAHSLSFVPPLRNGSTTQQRALDRIDEILSATAQELAACGHDKLSIVNIAARAGIKHTSIYHYFKSIDDILVTLISRMMADYDSMMAGLILEANSASALVEAYVTAQQKAWLKYRNTPTARGLWANARYLSTLNRIDYDYNTRVALVFCEKFKHLAPHADHQALHLAMSIAVSLSVPTFELALLQPKNMQRKMVDEFIAMTRNRLCALLALTPAASE